jgi:aerotaxis receptor
MASGDLTHREPSLPMTHVLGKVMARVQRLQLNIRAVVGDAMEEMEKFSAVSAEMAQSALDLSAVPNPRPAAWKNLPRPWSNSATVENSSEAAQKVVRESHHSAELATQGGQAVNQVSQVVGAIEQSSRKMGQIISTIEGIAFQTNILALNAAVEAARAGEQGRGFAVVAGEVRSLAQRSSEAAKEIQALINESASNIGRGAGLMQSASKTIEQVVQSVAHVNTLMGQMGVAAREQAEGISQVNEAVTLLDRDTQQNAALAEQSAAASRVMSDSAAVLGRTLEVFACAELTDARCGRSSASPAGGWCARG